MKSIKDIKQKFESALVTKLSWIWIIVNASVMLTGIFIYSPASFRRWIYNVIIVSIIGSLSLVINRFGYTKIASYVLPGFMFIHIAILGYTGGGTSLPGIANFIPIIFTTGFLLGRNKGLIMALLCIASVFGLAILETNGLLPEVNFVRSPIGKAVALLLPISIAAVIQYFATDHLSESLVSLKNEMIKREEAERIKDQSVLDLKERVKELRTLAAVSYILQNEEASSDELFSKLCEVIPGGWQYPEATAVRILVNDKEYTSQNYKPTNNKLFAEIQTIKGTKIGLEVVSLYARQDFVENLFLDEEDSLTQMLIEMIKVYFERREKKAELKDYKYALDISAIVSISKVDGTFTYVNDNFCKISKYQENELLGEHHSILWSGFHSPEYFNELKYAMEGGGASRAEFCNKAKDGTLYWVDSSVIPFLDDNGKVYQYLSIGYDISDRKDTVEKLQISEERYKSIISVSNIGAWEYRINEEHVWYSEQYFSMLGLDVPNGSWDSNINDTWIERLHPDDRKISIEKFNNYLKEGSKGLFEIFFRMRHENGSWVWIWSRGKRLRDEHDKLTNIILGSHIDISERKKAEEDIRQSEQLLRKITSQVPGNTYMFEIDENGKSDVLFMNRGTDKFNHDYDSEQLKNNSDIFREVLHDDDKIMFNDAMKEAYRTEELISFQYRVVLKDKVRWRWMQAAPEKDKNGKIVWYGATTDITPIVEYIASIQQVMFDISHVIRRPITTMTGLVKGLIDFELSDQEVKEFSRELHVVLEEMDRFTRELSDVYNQKSKNSEFNIDTSSLIDKRTDLFS